MGGRTEERGNRSEDGSRCHLLREVDEDVQRSLEVHCKCAYDKSSTGNITERSLGRQ